MQSRVLGVLVLLAALLAGWAAPAAVGGGKQDSKRKGTVVGVLTAKGDKFIEVRADGEEKARKYVPHWVGGAPAQGGGFDKAILKQIATLKVGSRIRLQWDFEERPRIVRVDVLRPADAKDKK